MGKSHCEGPCDKGIADYLLFPAIILLLICSVWRLYQNIPNNTMIDHPGGAQITLAIDLSEGLFYRPPVSELGYGGTRYMPGHFAMLAGLTKLTGNVLWSGYFISIVSCLGLMAGVYFLLRNLNCGVQLSIAGALLLLVLGQVQFAVSTIRSDITATMFSLWGLAFFAGAYEKQKGWMYWFAGLFFIFAFVTKFTDIFFLGGACLFLFLKGKRLKSVIFFIAVVTGMAASTLVLNYLSEGRMWLSMRYCLTGGEIFWKGPVKLLRSISDYDSTGLIVLFLGIAALIFLKFRQLSGILAITFIVTGIGTIMMFFSPGVDLNHLLGVEVIAVPFLIVLAAHEKIPQKFTIALFTIIVLLASAYAVTVWRHDDVDNVRKQNILAAQTLTEQDKPLLIQDAGVAVLAGIERPYVQDPWAIRHMRLRDKSLDEDFIDKINNKFFGAIILMGDPDALKWWNGPMFENSHFGEGFVPALKENYIKDSNYPEGFVYIPKAEQDE